jgi:hypothetical protein
VLLAFELGISTSDVNLIKTEYPDNVNQQAMVMLRLWLHTSGNKATGKQVTINGLQVLTMVSVKTYNQCFFCKKK